MYPRLVRYSFGNVCEFETALLSNFKGGYAMAIKVLLCLLAVLFMSPVFADAYKWKDAEGQTHYGDAPVAFVSSSAMVEWREVGKDKAHAITTYADPASIRRSGGTAVILHLYDFRTPQTTAGKQYRSVKQRREFDCKKKISRSTKTSVFAGNMGSGMMVENVGAGDWSSVIQETPIAYLMYIACTQ